LSMRLILSARSQQVIRRPTSLYSLAQAIIILHLAEKSPSSSPQLDLSDWETLLLPDLVTKDLISTLGSSSLMPLTGLGCGLI
jgi:hypothetical protein